MWNCSVRSDQTGQFFIVTKTTKRQSWEYKHLMENDSHLILIGATVKLISEPLWLGLDWQLNIIIIIIIFTVDLSLNL